MKLRPYQERGVDSIFDYFQSGKTGNPVVAMPTACHAAGHQILMFDGTTKAVEDVVVGDLLMGDDSTPRTVLKLATGRQEMRRVIPKIGESFVVNLDHKISCYVTAQDKNSPFACEKARIETVTLRQYEEGSKTFRHLRKLRRVPVDFSNKSQPLNPYLIGILLGDGSMCNGTVSLTTADFEIGDWFVNELAKLEVSVRLSRKPNNRACSFVSAYSEATRSIPNPLTKILRDLGLMEQRAWDKHIPNIYKTGDKEQRLQLLAGLIDSDGYIENGNIEYTTASKTLAKDVQFLARSLGFSASVTEREIFLYGVKKRNSFRLHISGDLSTLPFVRKKHIANAEKRKCQKNKLVTGFTLEKLPEDIYYGFLLDGNHLYLDENFIVHHNTGKSVVIGGFIKRAFQYPNQRVLNLTHRKELIDQNFEKLLTMWPTAPAGIYSAGLGKKESHLPITFAGIGSVANKHHLFGKIDLVLIDECHLVSPDETTTYRKFINSLTQVNPYLKTIGFSATPWRIGQGKLTDEGGLFTDICYDITTLEEFNNLLEEGYLAQLVPHRTNLKLDTDSLHKRGGDFIQSETEALFDRDEITIAALQETLDAGHDRNHGMIFGSGINHCLSIERILKQMGQSCAVVHSKQDDKLNDFYIAEFKAGRIRFLINNDKLTTGFDYPGIDLIVMLRATASIVLWIQMLGRGARPLYAPGYDLETKEGRLAAMEASEKQDCLVMDFANNTKRLGPINDPVLPKKKGKGGGECPVKECPDCQTLNHPSVRFCINKKCNHEFIFQIKITETAANLELIKQTALPIIEPIPVRSMAFQTNIRRGKRPSLKISYQSNLQSFSEVFALEHDVPSVRVKAGRMWTDQGGKFPPPASVTEALTRTHELRTPHTIRVWLNAQYPTIMSKEFD